MGTRHVFDALGGIVRTVEYDYSDDIIIFGGIQDVEPFLERNKSLYNDGTKGDSAGKNFRRVASIPPIVVEELYRRGIWPQAKNGWDRTKLRKWLNDSENRFFRTAPGRI